MGEEVQSCVEPAGGPIIQEKDISVPDEPQTREVKKIMAKVGGAAPDFEAAAFIDGGFKNIKLSDYKGQWVVLCFYPGDFTFV